jgi:hypothetical protein
LRGYEQDAETTEKAANSIYNRFFRFFRVLI